MSDNWPCPATVTSRLDDDLQFRRWSARMVNLFACKACPYWMAEISKCGYLVDGKRGNGEGDEAFVLPEPVKQ